MFGHKSKGCCCLRVRMTEFKCMSYAYMKSGREICSTWSKMRFRWVGKLEAYQRLLELLSWDDFFNEAFLTLYDNGENRLEMLWLSQWFFHKMATWP